MTFLQQLTRIARRVHRWVIADRPRDHRDAPIFKEERGKQPNLINQALEGLYPVCFAAGKCTCSDEDKP